MARTRRSSAAAIVLAVVVVATAAAGLVDTRPADDASGAGVGVGNGSGIGTGNGSAIGFAGESGELAGFPVWVVRGGLALFMQLSIGILFVTVAVLVLTRSFEELRRLATDAAMRTLGLALFLGGLVLFTIAIGQLFGEGGGGLLGSATGPPTAGSGARGADRLVGPGLPANLLVVAGLVVVGLVLVLTSEEESASTPTLPTGSDVEPAHEKRPQTFLFHGSPADVAPTNDVYRAWATLASEVAVTESTTPGEVAREATDAGYDADAVDELTALFLEARYGSEPPDRATERRATELSEHLVDAGPDET